MTTSTPEADWARALTSPRSIALVGISPRPGFATTVLRNLETYGFAGNVHLVNPGYDELHGRPCHKLVEEIPGGVDLALVFRAAAGVPDAVADCGRAGVRVVIVYASGFAETGVEGEALQWRTADIAREHGVRVLGPNCQGWYHRNTGLAAAFTPSLDGRELPSSGVAYIGQSGAIGGAILSLAGERGIGFEAWASVGNELDLNVTEVAGILVGDSRVRVLALYLESVPEGSAWIDLLQRAQDHDTDVVLLRSGRSEQGRRVAASHTGALVRPDVAFTLVNQHYGVTEVHDVLDLVEVVDALTLGSAPTGHAVAVITSSGGAGGMVADELDGSPLGLADLEEFTRSRLKELVPAFGTTDNPVDVTAQLFASRDERLTEVYAAVAADPGVDAVLVVLTGAAGDLATWIAERIAEVAAATDTRFAVVWMVPDRAIEEARRILRAAGVFVTPSIASAVRTLSLSGTRPPSQAATTNHAAADPAALRELLEHPGPRTEWGAAPLLDALGLPRPRSVLATCEQEALAAVAELGSGPYVLKIQSPQIAHKSEVGGVVVGVEPGDVVDAYRSVLRGGESVAGAELEGVLVQTMHPTAKGLDLLVGVQGAEHGYPPVVTVGLGGVTAEVHKDVVSGLAPLDRSGAAALLRRLRSWPLLDGYRLRPALAVEQLVDALSVVSEAAVALGPVLDHLEINPLHVGPQDVAALDVLLTSNGNS